MTRGYLLFIVVGLLFQSGCAAPAYNLADRTDIVKIYYPTGVLKTVWESRDGKVHGFKREYSQEGILMTATQYRNSVIDGIRNIYNERGAMWKKEIYVNGRMIRRMEYNEEGFMVSDETMNGVKGTDDAAAL